MRLVQLFEQRIIGRTHGSVASSIPLKKPSGPQWTESELETKLVEQLDFSARVHDIITQPGIRYQEGAKDRLYTPDVFIELWPDQEGSWSYYLVEVKRSAELSAWRRDNKTKIAAAKEWCAHHHAQYRIVTEREIETPHLRNARRLNTKVGRIPDEEILDALKSLVRSGPSRAFDLIEALVDEGLNEPDVRDALDAAVANRHLGCDLSIPYDDNAQIRRADPLGREYNDRDPIIRLLMHADSG